MEQEKIFYVKIVEKGEEGNPYKVYGHPWSTHETVYSSQVGWFSPYDDLIILEADTGIEKTYSTYINNDGSYRPIVISEKKNY